MDVDKDGRVEELFSDALDVPDADRLAWLERECAGDIELLAEIHSLLRAYHHAPRLIDRSLLTRWSGPPPDMDPDVMAGRVLGPWRIVEHIATGGMATVYLGERVDDSFRKKVAIKILAAGSFHPGLLSSFRTERQVLADLDHPGIARLLDGGTTDEGVPYLVMEHVEGATFRDAVQARSMTIEERLRLFLDVAEAVQYAHANLVIHRDLKPGNILVRPDGRIKLLDFGIAKVFESRSSQAGSETTVGTAWAMTPRYASPEQISGRRVTTSSDIYSLGVVLYEILTGRLPYEVDRGSVIEVGRAICEAPPIPPSRLRDGANARRFAGDLDTILLKALAKEPERRYRSVADFAEDVRRHLDGEPVLARGDSAGYRLIRFARKNKGLVTGVVAIFAMLVVALAISLTFYRKAVDSAAAARWSTYTSTMAAAESAIMSHSTSEARELLDQTEPKYRGWEFRHLSARLDRSRSGWKAHKAQVTGVRMYRDGTRLLTASLDSTARIWAAGTHDSLAAWSFPDDVESSRFLAGGERIVVGLGRGAVMTAAIGEEPALLGRGTYWAIIDVDPSGRLVAAGFENGELALFDVDSRQELRRWKAHFRLTAPAFSPDGSELATAGSDSVVRIWSLPEGRLKRTLRGHRRRVYNLAYSLDGRKLVTGSSDQTATVWDLETGVALSSFAEHRGVPAKQAFHPDGRSVITAGSDGRLLIWDAITGGRRAEYYGHRTDVTSLSISPDGSLVLTGEVDGTVREWDWGTDDVRVLSGLSAGSQTADIFPLPDFDMEPTGRRMITFNGRSYPEGRITMVRDAFGGEWPRYAFPYLSAVGILDSSTYVVGTERGKIYLCQVLGEGLDAQAPVDSVAVAGPIASLAVDRPRAIVACGEGEGVISLRTLPLLRTVRSWAGHTDPVRQLAFNDAGTLLASADRTGCVRLWNPNSGDSLGTALTLGSEVTDLAFHPTGPVLAITTESGAAFLWHFDRGGACDTLKVAGQGSTCVTFDRDGSRIVLGSQDGLIHLLDAARRSEVVRLHGHLARVTAVRFTGDGNTLVSSSFDGSLRVWDTGTRLGDRGSSGGIY